MILVVVYCLDLKHEDMDMFGTDHKPSTSSSNNNINNDYEEDDNDDDNNNNYDFLHL
jgi:hypothetical protein